MSDDRDEIFSDPMSASRGPPIEVHNHYDNRKNGNGNGTAVLLKISLGISGALLLGLLGLNAYLWRDNNDFQRNVIDRLARLEAIATNGD